MKIVNKLHKGDKVVMHDCMEAHGRENVVWECNCDSYEMCGSKVVFLKGYSGSFDTEFLRKVEDSKKCVKDYRRIKKWKG